MRMKMIPQPGRYRIRIILLQALTEVSDYRFAFVEQRSRFEFQAYKM